MCATKRLILAGGDFHPLVRSDRRDFLIPKAEINPVRNILESAECSLINLETPICSAGSKTVERGPSLRPLSPPSLH